MTSLISVNISFNSLTGSLPPKWLKFLKANPDSFIGNPDLCIHYNTSTEVCMNQSFVDSRTKAKLSVRVIMAMILGIALALAIFVAFSFWWLRAIKLVDEKPMPLKGLIVKNLTNAPLPFTFEEIMAATENLSEAYIIGRGGHGVVYKASLATGTTIAVKKIESQNMALIHKSFWNEIKIVGNVRHRNLVRLLGFMKWDKVGLLLYEYVSNGNLHSALHNKDAQGNVFINLPWKTRLRIAEGVAHGLAYLHHDYNPPIVHRDIKSSNVLLDSELEARISDFGLAKVLIADNIQLKSQQQLISTLNVAGTYGYIAPGKFRLKLHYLMKFALE